MAERMLITKLIRTEPTRADLYGRGHRFKDLTLFDLGELGAVGIDFEALPISQEVPCRFWAHYTLSDKLNQAGNPYKDVVALEAMDKPATSTSTDNSALLAELRAIRAILQGMATAQGMEIPTVANDVGEPDAAFPRYGDGSPVGDNPAELDAYQAHVEAEGNPPANLEALRSWTRAKQ